MRITSSFSFSLEVKICRSGILHGTNCCAASCGTCGGPNCGSWPGGSDLCCAGTIQSNGIICETADQVGCIVDCIKIIFL